MITRNPATDMLIDVVDGLDDAIAILNVSWAGLCCEGEFLTSEEDCRSALFAAITMVKQVRDAAEGAAVEITESRN